MTYMYDGFFMIFKFLNIKNLRKLLVGIINLKRSHES